MLGACEAILPHMATGDDGEYDRGAFEIVCPKTNMRNRVLFFGSNKHIAEDEFYSTYKRLFKNLVEVYGLSNKDSNWKNNMYFDQNRKKFGLTENKDAA